MVSMVASTSCSANSLATWPSKSALRLGDSWALVADLGNSALAKSWIFITLLSLDVAHPVGWHVCSGTGLDWRRNAKLIRFGFMVSPAELSVPQSASRSTDETKSEYDHGSQHELSGRDHSYSW